MSRAEDILAKDKDTERSSKSPISGWEISSEDGQVTPCFESRLPDGPAYSKDIDALEAVSRRLSAYCAKNHKKVSDVFQSFRSGELAL